MAVVSMVDSQPYRVKLSRSFDGDIIWEVTFEAGSRARGVPRTVTGSGSAFSATYGGDGGEVSTPVGYLKGECKLPFSAQQAEEVLLSVWRSDQGSVQRSHFWNVRDPIKEAGKLLFEALFDGPLRYHYERAMEIAEAAGRALCMILELPRSDGELAAMPWEFLYDDSRRDFMALSIRSPLVRYTDVPRSASPVQPPLRVLALASEVGVAMGIEEEIEILVRLETETSLLKLAVVRDATPDTARDSIIKTSPHVIHFLGHGISSDMQRNLGFRELALVMAGEKGERFRPGKQRSWPWLLTADELKLLLGDQADLRLLYLSACDTYELASAVSPAVPATLGIRNQVTVEAVHTFTEAFYRAVLDGNSLEAAATAARQSVDARRPGSREWGLLTLYSSPAVLLALPSQPSRSGLEIGADSRITSQPSPGHQEEWEYLQSMLAIRKRNLHALESRKRSYEASSSRAYLDRDLDLEIERTEDRIRELERQIDGLNA